MHPSASPGPGSGPSADPSGGHRPRPRGGAAWGALFSVVDRGSAALLAHDALVHPLPHPGQFELQLFRGPGHRVARRLSLWVREATLPLSLTVDLAQVSESSLAGPPEHVVCAGGALCLHGGGAERDGAWALLVSRAGGVVWDSRALAAGDQFVFVPMRPGRHVLSERPSGWTQTLTVRYPDPRAKPPSAASDTPAPVVRLLRLRAGATDAAIAALDPGQTVSVVVPPRSLGGARFELHLEQADDGPPDLAEWRRQQDALALSRLR